MRRLHRRTFTVLHRELELVELEAGGEEAEEDAGAAAAVELAHHADLVDERAGSHADLGAFLDGRGGEARGRGGRALGERRGRGGGRGDGRRLDDLHARRGAAHRRLGARVLARRGRGAALAREQRAQRGAARRGERRRAAGLVGAREGLLLRAAPRLFLLDAPPLRLRVGLGVGARALELCAFEAAIEGDAIVLPRPGDEPVHGGEGDERVLELLAEDLRVRERRLARHAPAHPERDRLGGGARQLLAQRLGRGRARGRRSDAPSPPAPIVNSSGRATSARTSSVASALSPPASRRARRLSRSTRACAGTARQTSTACASRRSARKAWGS